MNFGNRPLASLLNRSVAELGSLGLMGIVLICDKDTYMSALVSWHIFIVL